MYLPYLYTTACSGSHEVLRAALSLLQLVAELVPLPQHAAVLDVVQRLRGKETFLDFGCSDPQARCEACSGQPDGGAFVHQ